MAARVIKETLDKKYGPSWHTVVGEGYGFHISYECKTMMYLFFAGNLGICIWKNWCLVLLLISSNYNIDVYQYS